MNRLIEDISIECNVYLLMRERGKVVQGSCREGHNILTVTGKNWLSKLVGWKTIAGTDVPYTHRRVRWMGVGSGTQLEVSTVAALVQPRLATSTDYLRSIQRIEFPTSTSVRFLREFGTSEITILASAVPVSEVGLFVDVSPATAGGSEDASYDPLNPSFTTLNPTIGTNPPVAYKAFEALTKSPDFSLEVSWEFRF